MARPQMRSTHGVVARQFKVGMWKRKLEAEAVEAVNFFVEAEAL